MSTSKSFSSIVSFYRGSVGLYNWPTAVYLKDSPWYGNSVIRDAYTATGNSTRADNLIGWKQAIREGRSATTDVNATKKSFTGHHGSVGGVYSSGTGVSKTFTSIWQKGHICLPPNAYNFAIPPSERQILDDIAQLDFLKKCARAQRKFQSPTFLAELHEVVSMFRHPIRGIVNELVKHKGRLKKAVTRSGRLREFRSRSRQGPSATAQRIISDQWLQTQFGLLPFISDMDDAADAIRSYFDRMSDSPTRIPVKAFSSREFTNARLDPFASGPSGLEYKFLRTDKRQEKVTYRGAVKLVPYADQAGSALRTHFGFDWQTAVLTAWEIIPYSFLVDYFINIGDILEASLFNQTNLAWVNRSWKSNGSASIEISGGTVRLTLPENSPSVYTLLEKRFGTGAIGTCNMVAVERLGIHWDLKTSFQFRVPGWGLKAANLAALARLRFF